MDPAAHPRVIRFGVFEVDLRSEELFKNGRRIKLQDQPGWVTMSLDGRCAYPSSGEVIDTHSKKILATLKDENGKPVQSEKMVEIVFRDGKPVQAGDQFGLGRRR